MRKELRRHGGGRSSDTPCWKLVSQDEVLCPSLAFPQKNLSEERLQLRGDYPKPRACRELLVEHLSKPMDAGACAAKNVFSWANLK